MPRPQWDGWIDLSDVPLKQRFMRWIGQLTGQYEVSIEPRRNMRSNQQLRWWWPCVVNPFFEFLKDQDFSVNCNQHAHDIIREKFLRVPAIVDRESGEVISWRTRHTKELTTAEFSEFAEKARAWLMSEFGIVTLDPNEDLQQAAAAAGK